jgi:hypothetical protein
MAIKHMGINSLTSLLMMTLLKIHRSQGVKRDGRRGDDRMKKA